MHRDDSMKECEDGCLMQVWERSMAGFGGARRSLSHLTNELQAATPDANLRSNISKIRNKSYVLPLSSKAFLIETSTYALQC